ncbi:hypothetical protein [Bradyrhizobium lablabi]|uniref:hypothetical protein n=1 Tax=Bradyrhizobium lablabi TaxID=722472 RepID=UPI001BAC6878|nr:hypothetical protein [Bradyrhizobium lablabi]MBR0696852.1 hypothetical protein [Bradyrhizobium lablabi]
MQDGEPGIIGRIWSNDAAGGRLPERPVDLWDFPSATRDEVLMVREPFGDRMRTMSLVAAAVVASFVLGWVGALNWPEFTGALGSGQMAQKDTPAPHVADARPISRSNGARRTASTYDPAVTGSIPRPSPSMLPGARLPAAAAAPANPGDSGVVLAMRQPLAPAPETRPTTISGWTVIEVRDGTAVLEGPDGIKMAARGDTIPGIGRVDSIVRWGNRWIVATASGLIATP